MTPPVPCLRNCRAAACAREEIRPEIAADHRVEFRRREIDRLLLDVHAGIAHQNVELAIAPDSRLDQGFRPLWRCHIGQHRQRLVALGTKFSGRGLGPLETSRAAHHDGAGLGETMRQLAPDAAAGSGNDGHPAGEIEKLHGNNPSGNRDR